MLSVRLGYWLVILEVLDLYKNEVCCSMVCICHFSNETTEIGLTEEARMERDKELYERQIKIVDTQIDGMVYDLYGLTGEAIKVVGWIGKR